MKKRWRTDVDGCHSLESDLTIAVISMMGRLRLKEIALYAGEDEHVGTFRFRKNRIWFYPATARSCAFRAARFPENTTRTGCNSSRNFTNDHSSDVLVS